MTFAEKGAVADIDPALFVGYLHRLKATGTLKFEDGSIQRAIYLRDGRVLFSSSNAPEDQLGAILVAGGKISKEQFDGLVAALEPKQSIAAALAQGGHVSQRDIGDAARRKVEQIVGSCCAQTTGRYEFEDGVLPKGALDLKLTTERVLISAFEALEPSGFLIRILKSPMAVLARADFDPADPELVRLREALDGSSSLSDTGGKAGLAPAATEVRAAVLVVLGAATVVTSQIEAMSLPDTGEGLAALPDLELADAEIVEAETIAFKPAPPASSPSASSDATLMMGPSDNAAFSSEATLVMDSGLDLATPSSPSDSGIFRAGALKKASTQDLAAVKELIGLELHELPPPPSRAQVGASSRGPVLSAGRGGSVPPTGLAGLVQNPLVRRAAGVLVLLIVGVIGWLAYSSQSGRPAQVATAPAPVASAPTPPVSAATKVAPAGVQPSPLAAPPSAATGPSPASAKTVVPAPVASPNSTPAAVKPSAPSPLPVPSPAAKVTPIPPTPPKASPPQAPVPGPTAVTRPAPSAPSSSSAPTSSSAPSSSSAYEAMKAGRLTEAALAFESIARSRSGEHSVQIMVACSAQTIAKAIEKDPSTDLFILPATITSKPCHRMMRGFFKTDSEAAQAVSGLPAYYTAEGAKPRGISLKSVLR